MVARSQNGWVANDSAFIAPYKVPNTNVTLRLRKGDAAIVLLWAAVYFDQHVEKISTQHGVSGFNIPDDWGYAARNVRGSTTVISNHASGTAEDLNATRHPRGVPISHTFSRVQINHVHDLIALSGGVLRWGGDYKTAPPDGMHLEINKGSAAVSLLADKIRKGKVPGSWVGFPAAPPSVTPLVPKGSRMQGIFVRDDGRTTFFFDGTFLTWMQSPDHKARQIGACAAQGVKVRADAYDVAAGSIVAGKYGSLIGAVPPGYEKMPRLAMAS